jgi:group I intron endonuclease
MVIYLITNQINGKKYVGQHCGKKDSRWKQHLNSAIKIQDPKPLYAAMRKYGAENFSYKVLEDLPYNTSQSFLDEREKFFINEYNTYIKYGKGYNLTLGGGGNMATYCSTERSEQQSETMEKTDYAKYNPETGELIHVYDKLTQAARENNIRNSSYIRYSNTYEDIDNKVGSVFKQIGNFIWVSGPEGYDFPENIKIRKIVKQSTKNREYKTEIAQYALSGLLVHVWDEPPAEVAMKLSIPYPSLLKALKGEQRVVSGYFWRRFPKGQSPDEIEDRLQTHVIKLSKRQLTNFPIFKYVSGRQVMKYQSVMDAIIDNNLAPTQILNSLELGKPDEQGSDWKWVTRPTHIRHSEAG